MKLIAPSTRPSFRIARLAAAVAVLAGALTAASVFHISPVVLAAQQSPAAQPAAVIPPAPAPAPPAPPPAPPSISPAPAPEPPAPPAVAPLAPRAPSAPIPPAHPHHPADANPANHAATDLPPDDLIGPQDMKFNFKFFPKFTEFNQPDMQALQARITQQMASINASFNSPEFKLKIKQLADSAAKIHSADATALQLKINLQLQQQMKELSSPEFQQRLAEAQRKIAEAKLDSPEFKSRIAEASRRQAESAKQLAEASAKIAEARTHVHDSTVQKQLDEAQKALDAARIP